MHLRVTSIVAACTVKVPSILSEDAACTVKVLPWCTWGLHQSSLWLQYAFSKHQILGESPAKVPTLWGSLQICTVKVPTLAEGVTSTVVVLSEYLPWVSPNMLVKAPNSGGVSCKATNTLRESPGMYCQSTNTCWGSHANRCRQVSPNMLVKAPNSGGVSCQSTNTLRESPGMYCQSTNTGWGSHVILAARCSPMYL